MSILKRSFFVFSVLVVVLSVTLLGCKSGTTTTTTTTTSKVVTSATTSAVVTTTTAPVTSSASSTTSAAPPKEYKIGISGPLTGAAAGYGLPEMRTITMMAEDVNKAGGFNVGGQTYMLKVISLDDAFDPKKSVDNGNQLIFQEKVDVVVGACGSTQTLALQTVTEANKVPLLADGGNPQLLGPDKPYTIRAIYPASSMLYVPLYSYLTTKMPTVKKMAFLTLSNSTGDNAKVYGGRYASANGISVVAFEAVDPNTQDFYPALTKILAAKPDIIEVPMPVAQWGLAVKQARELGWTGPMSTINSLSTSAFLSVAGAAAEGVLYPTFVYDGPDALPGMVAFKKEFIDRWGAANWDTGAGVWIPVVPSIIRGLQTAGTTDKSKLIDGMLAAKAFDTPMGPAFYAGKGIYGVDRQLYHGGIAVGTIKNGQWVALLMTTAQQNADAELNAWVKGTPLPK